MSRKKLIRLALLVIIAIVSLIILENSIRGIKNFAEEKKEQKIEEENSEKYESSEEYKEEQLLTGIVGEFAELLKNKDVDKLYSLIEENYKDYKYQNSKEAFEKHMEKYMKNDVNLSLQTYEIKNNRYYCRILSESEEGVSTFVALIKPTPDNTSYTVIFDNISSITKMEKTYKDSSNIECNVIYKVTAEKTCIYTIEFVNSNNKEINYSLNSATIINSKGESYSSKVEDKSINLRPGENIRKNLVINASGVHSYPVTSLIIDIKDENGKVKSMQVYMDDIMDF